MNAIKGLSAATLLISSIATPALAETRPGMPAPTTAGTPDPVAKDKRYCVVETFTGSRLQHKICKTRARWMDQGFDPLAPRK